MSKGWSKKQPRRILNWDLVRKIREDKETSPASWAEQTGVSERSIVNVLNGTTWNEMGRPGETTSRQSRFVEGSDGRMWRKLPGATKWQVMEAREPGKRVSCEFTYTDEQPEELS